jgi:glucose-1-phosphate thymidylyltransferase
VSVPRPPIGLLPAAGRGVRFGASGYAKELFPLLFEGPADGDFEPRPICELALRAIQAAGAERCVTVVSREKVELLRVLGEGLEVGMALAYVVQPEPRGLPDVVRCARPWIGDGDTVFAMPDTVFLPGSALSTVQAMRVETGADVVLGVFPVDEPERLGPVEIGPDGSVLHILDKPGVTPHRNTWGVASWSGRFTSFCCEWADSQEARSPKGELLLGHAFEAAREQGLAVRAVQFAGGQFLDVGTPRGLRAALSALATRGVLIADQAATARGPHRP